MDILNGFVIFLAVVLSLHGAFLLGLGAIGPRVLDQPWIRTLTFCKSGALSRSDLILSGLWLAIIGGQQLLSISEDYDALRIVSIAVSFVLTIVMFRRLSKIPGLV